MRWSFAYILTCAMAPTLSASPMIYSGFDADSLSLAASPNATSAAADFDAAAPTARIDTFNSPVNPDFIRTNGAWTGSVICPNTFSYNTTAGGGQFICDILAAEISFSFGTQPIDAFGLYLTSYQGSSSIVRVLFDDFSQDILALADVDGRGTYFFGYENTGASIIDVAFRTSRFIFGYDDFRYRFSPASDDTDGTDPPPVDVAAPATVVLIGMGLISVRLRRKA